MSRRDALKSGVAGILIGVPLALGAAISRSVAAPTEDISGYKLDSGDKIKVTVFGHEDLSGEFEVDGTGNVSLPLIRDVKAAGLTARQLEKTIAERLSPDYLLNPSVSVEVLNYRPFYIYGEVTKPGSYPFVNGMTVITAVAMAGGFTYRARTSRVHIIRADDESRTPVDADRDTAVLPGDVIEVPERYF
ncbi:MAG: polysaccharide export protein [Rhodospirillales bacterium]|nr:polysaccharide export protein [Rhodospirillales bacterium]